jgi:hypothetical protein
MGTLIPMGAWCSSADTEPTKMRQRQTEDKRLIEQKTECRAGGAALARKVVGEVCFLDEDLFMGTTSTMALKEEIQKCGFQEANSASGLYPVMYVFISKVATNSA